MEQIANTRLADCHRSESQSSPGRNSGVSEMNDGPLAAMLAELDAELALQQSLDARDLVAGLVRAPDRLGVEGVRNGQTPAIDAPAQ